MKTKYVWIKMKESDSPAKCEPLPFILNHEGKEYKVTGGDFVDRVWRGELVC